MTDYPPSSPISGYARRPRLIAEWPSAWRLWSVRIAALGAGLMAAWSSLPSEVRAALPYADQLAAGLFIAVTAARLIAQDDRASATPDDETSDTQVQG